MRWTVFILFAFLMLVLDEGLDPLLGIPDQHGITPSFLLIIAVFVMESAPRTVALWAALVVGLLVDLTEVRAVAGSLDDVVGSRSTFVLIGPWCLGYLAGAAVAIEMRGLVFRDSPWAFALMVILVGIFVHLVLVAVLTLRSLVGFTDAVANWHAADELLRGFLELIYTGALAVPIGWLLLRSDPLWGFQSYGTAGHARIKRIN